MTGYRVGLLLICCYLVSGCTDDRNGKFVTHWIACEKSGNGDWLVADREFYNRFNVIGKSEYQVSFDTQRVVTSRLSALKDCIVFDRKNWFCDGHTRLSNQVHDGNKMNYCDSSPGYCFLHLGIFYRLYIYFGGVGQADRSCRVMSDTFDRRISE